ncbi:B3 domain-containing protein Os01g0723500 isoform X1 [Pyrus x bretschneideri]|uniref:B3 domain-containing protein Os01g0723500 isoform X1 n=1 Tax=Pyrus x bretschneideri TaxID=225117 RepID=UPI002030688E|nr:B3 domain-containing protein Os01g0723500 isoform X1 [Pyrus x bretschneideri]
MAEEAGNVRSPHFFAFYSADLSSERLKIPERFMRHMEGKTSGLVALFGPSGSAWSVELIEQNGGLFLHHGWPAFVRDHYVECGDFLIFRYDGDLRFTVLIFDQSACEKEAAFRFGYGQDSRNFEKYMYMGRKRGREEVASSGNKLVDGAVKKIRNGSSQFRSECIGEGREEETCSTEKNPHENPGLDVVSYKAKASIQNMCGKGDGLNVHGRVCMQMSSAHEVAPSFSSSNPYFVRIIKSFNISGSYTLNIPYKFSVAHLPNCKVKIVLQNWKGESWTVNSVPSNRVHTSHTLCGGWMAFVRYNDIQLGDICTFELMRECEFRVHIQKGETSSWLSPGLAVTTHKTIKCLSKKMKGNSPKVLSKSIREIADKLSSKKDQDAAFINDTRKYGSTSRSLTKAALAQSKVASKKLVNRRKKVVEDELDSKSSGLRIKLTLDEERIARSFTSCYPNFVKIMKKFNISGSYTLKIPYQFSTEYLPNYKTEIVLRNSKGECWTVNSVPDSKGRVVHTFCGGWMAFVRGNDINIGDVCIFELVGKDEMQVHISSVGKKGFEADKEHLM